VVTREVYYDHTDITNRTDTIRAMSANDEPTSNETEKRPRDEESSDPFLASMTFASVDRSLAIGCDCDECGTSTRGSSGGAGYVPAAIAEAVKRYKAAMSSMPLKRTQDRYLVKRFSGVSVYEWTLPVEAQPLVEYGNSHRLVWIQRLSTTSVIKSIGKGIIGSADEEKQRVAMDWKQGQVVLVPSNGGKAVGWIHHNGGAASTKDSTEEDADNKNTGHASLRIAKAPVDLAAAEGDAAAETEMQWHDVIRSVCERQLKKEKESTTSIVLDETDSQLIREAMQ